MQISKTAAYAKKRGEIQAAYRPMGSDSVRQNKYFNTECNKYREDLATGKHALITDLYEREACRTCWEWKQRQHCAC